MTREMSFAMRVKLEQLGDATKARAQLIQKIQTVIHGAQAGIERIDRDQSLYPAERELRKAQRKENARAEVAELEKQFAAQVEAQRALTIYRPDPPEGDALARRAYYAQVAASEMAGLSGDAAIEMVRQIAATGDDERAQEYVSAARGIAREAGREGELTAIFRQVEPLDAKVHRAMAVGTDALTGASPYSLRDMIDGVFRHVGHIPDSVKAGVGTSEVDTSILEAWNRDAEKASSDAYRAHMDAEGREASGEGGDSGGESE